MQPSSSPVLRMWPTILAAPRQLAWLNPTRPQTQSPALPQALLLRRMAVYFDTDAEFWAPLEGVSWRELAPHDWDDWFLPGISSERQERGGTARHRQYVLQPVDGRAQYTRRGAGVTHKGELHLG